MSNTHQNIVGIFVRHLKGVEWSLYVTNFHAQGFLRIRKIILGVLPRKQGWEIPLYNNMYINQQYAQNSYD